MGTNYYITGNEELDMQHIGKRSAAGLYCWDCGVTLHKEGTSRLHYTSNWHTACPRCGNEYVDEPLSASAVGIELGFGKDILHTRTGVCSCSSFIWAITKETLQQLADKMKVLCGRDDVIVDEYGSTMSIVDFMAMLSKVCPIEFTHSIGKDFS